jgi:ketopantoate reductase
LAHHYLEEQKLELEKEKVMLEEKREEEKLKLEQQKTEMSERERKSNVLIALVNAGGTEEEIASLLKHI